MTRYLLSCIALASTALAAQAQTAPAAVDAELVRQAAQANLTEIEIGRLAATNAKSDTVKKFADTMIAEHTDNNAALATVAKNAGIAMPQSLDALHAATRASLAALNGTDFDHAYVVTVRQEHQAEIDQFGAANVQNAALKDYVADTRTSAERQFKSAQDLPDN